MSKLDLGGKGDDKDEPKKSPIGQALDSGTATVGNEQRKIVKGARKTTKGKVIQEQEEAARKQQEKFLKLQYPKADDEEDDWESDVEEDFPHVQLAELLDGLKLDENPANADDDEEDEDYDPKEEAKQADSQEEKKK